jgi:hypothetical protein
MGTVGSKLIEFNAAQVGCIPYYFVGMYYVPNLKYAVFVGLSQELSQELLIEFCLGCNLQLCSSANDNLRTLDPSFYWGCNCGSSKPSEIC